MGLVVSLILIAFGAILAFAVNSEPEGINVDAVGWILLIIGIISFLLTLLFWSSWWGPGYFTGGRGGYSRRTRYDSAAAPPAAPVDPYYGRSRSAYVEEEVDGPPAGPGAGPPPPPP
jgi:hypothetical protein